MHNLDPRLLSVAELLGEQKAVVDVGTDHAFLPIYLIKNGLAKKVIAMDIASGPLDVARKNIMQNGVSDKIELRLSNGLEKVSFNECTAVSVAGMGGETIAEILANADWIKNDRYTVVLQPMSCDDRLREFLYFNGFEIISEKAVFSKGRIYTVMKARYCGNKIKISGSLKYIGRLWERKDAAAEYFIKRRLRVIDKCILSISNVQNRAELLKELSEASKEIKEICSLKVKG